MSLCLWNTRYVLMSVPIVLLLTERRYPHGATASYITSSSRHRSRFSFCRFQRHQPGHCYAPVLRRKWGRVPWASRSRRRGQRREAEEGETVATLSAMVHEGASARLSTAFRKYHFPFCPFLPLSTLQTRPAFRVCSPSPSSSRHVPPLFAISLLFSLSSSCLLLAPFSLHHLEHSQ